MLLCLCYISFFWKGKICIGPSLPARVCSLLAAQARIMHIINPWRSQVLKEQRQQESPGVQPPAHPSLPPPPCFLHSREQTESFVLVIKMVEPLKKMLTSKTFCFNWVSHVSALVVNKSNPNTLKPRSLYMLEACFWWTFMFYFN